MNTYESLSKCKFHVNLYQCLFHSDFHPNLYVSLSQCDFHIDLILECIIMNSALLTATFLSDQSDSCYHGNTHHPPAVWLRSLRPCPSGLSQSSLRSADAPAHKSKSFQQCYINSVIIPIVKNTHTHKSDILSLNATERLRCSKPAVSHCSHSHSLV